MAAPVKFETTVEKLEGIVRKLEKGDLTLEESLKAFEEGIALAGTCEKLLQEAKGKVEILMKEKDNGCGTIPESAQGDR